MILNNEKIIDKKWKRELKEYLLKNMSTIMIPVAKVRMIKEELTPYWNGSSKIGSNPYKGSYDQIGHKRQRETAASESHEDGKEYPLNDNEKVTEEPRRSKRQKTSKMFGPDFLTFMVEDEPRTYKEALSSPKAPY